MCFYAGMPVCIEVLLVDDDSRPETKKFSERQWKRRSELKNGGFDEDLIGILWLCL